MKHSLLYSTLELEAAVIAAHEEISRKDEEIVQLKGLLDKIMKERDEFETKCQQLVLEKQLVFQQVQIQAHSSKLPLECPISSGTTSNEDDNNALSPSDCDDSSQGCKDSMPLTILTPPEPSHPDATDRVAIRKALPEQGKFLQVVMEAGPLLQTLLLAGPLPQWQHPPPQLSSGDIPPVTLSSPTSKLLRQDSCLVSPTTSGGGFSNKRGMLSREKASDFDFSPTSKYQKVCSPIIIDPINIIH